MKSRFHLYMRRKLPAVSVSFKRILQHVCGSTYGCSCVCPVKTTPSRLFVVGFEREGRGGLLDLIAMCTSCGSRFLNYVLQTIVRAAEPTPSNVGAIMHACCVLWLFCWPLGLTAFCVARKSWRQALVHYRIAYNTTDVQWHSHYMYFSTTYTGTFYEWFVDIFLMY